MTRQVRGQNKGLSGDNAMAEGSISKKPAPAACRCLTPPFSFQDFDRTAVGVDETNGRLGEVSVETCKACGRTWLRYFVEYEATERSGRWYRGLVSPAVARAITPQTAVAVLQGLEWRFAGGSHFESAGFKSADPMRLDP